MHDVYEAITEVCMAMSKTVSLHATPLVSLHKIFSTNSTLEQFPKDLYIDQAVLTRTRSIHLTTYHFPDRLLSATRLLPNTTFENSVASYGRLMSALNYDFVISGI